MKTVVAIGRSTGGGFDVETTMHTARVVDTREPFARYESYQAQCEDCNWVGTDYYGEDSERDAMADARDHTRGGINYG